MFEETGSLPLMKNANVRKQLDVVLTWKFDVIALEEVCKLQYALSLRLLAHIVHNNSAVSEWASKIVRPIRYKVSHLETFSQHGAVPQTAGRHC